MSVRACFQGNFTMMKVMQKYFLALIPPGDILEKANEIKIGLRDQFGVKYALKSPPHITVKMPFSYNEAKVHQLVASLQEYLKDQKPFEVKIVGVGRFGTRVVYLAVQKSEALMQLQQEVSKFCRTKLHLTEELSDRNYHPHMTVAFKDIKASRFVEIFDFVSNRGFFTEFSTGGIILLRRTDGMWNLQTHIPFGGDLNKNSDFSVRLSSENTDF